MNQVLENRYRWIEYLKRPDTKQTDGQLVSRLNPEARCCLGHACHVLDVPYNNTNLTYLGAFHYPPNEVVEALGLWNNHGGPKHYDPEAPQNHRLDNGETCLSNWNDRAGGATPQEIGAYLLTVIMGGPDTPFREIEA